LLLSCSSVVLAQTNLLYNGNFELTQTEYYYDAVADTNKFALPGWEAFAIGEANSYVFVSFQTNNWSLELSGSDADTIDFVGLAGIKTAVSNRVTVIPGQAYYATVNYDNYLGDAGISFFIDWFNGGGNNFSSSGGALPDPNGADYSPFTQRVVITGIAPGNAVRAGVRFQSANPDFVTATADNFVLGIQPKLTITRTGNNVVLSWTNAPTFVLQRTDSLSSTNWISLGSQNPQTNALSPGNAFYRLVAP
jgi:hypothetical protein